MKTLILLIITVLTVKAQETKLKLHTIYDKLDFSLGARERKDIPIDLPQNTVAWYYVFSTRPNKDGNVSLKLASSLLNALPFAETKSLAQVTDMIATPKGDFPCNVYLTDKKGRDSYLETDIMNAWNIVTPAHWKESLKGFVSGKMCVTSVKSGRVYLCLGNEAFTQGGYASLEVVALIPDNSVWSGEQIDEAHKKLLEIYYKSYELPETAEFMANCVIGEMILKASPVELAAMSEHNLNKMLEEIVPPCVDVYLDKKEDEKNIHKESNKALDYGNLAWSMYEDGDLDGCIEYSKKALEINNSLSFAKGNCGLCLLEKGLSTEAMEYYIDAANDLVEEQDQETMEYVIDDLEKSIAKKPDMKGASSILKLLKSKIWW